MKKQHNGTYKVQVGNIEPGSQIKVIFSYITFLEMHQGKYIFVIPTNIAPKYQLLSPRQVSYWLSNQPLYTKDKENLFKLNVVLTWESQGIIDKLESFTHKESYTFNGTETKRSISVELSPLQGDFNIAMTTRSER